MAVCERRLYDIDKVIDLDPNGYQGFNLISDSEWAILSSNEPNEEQF